MLDEAQVAVDVGQAMKDVITHNTPYTTKDWTVDRTGYRRDLVPSAGFWDGWQASRQAWDIIVRRIIDALETMNPGYAGVRMTVKETHEKRNQQLVETQALLTQKIMALGGGDD